MDAAAPLTLGLVVEHPGGRDDLVVTLPADATGLDLARLLARTLSPATPGPLRLRRTGACLADDVRLDEAGLRWGDVVVVGPGADAAPSSPAVLLHVVEGPQRGATARLAGGVHVVRRNAVVGGVTFTDPAISRGGHARFVVEAGRLVVEDLGSSNGTWVGDREVTAPRPLDAGDVVELGETLLRVELPTYDDGPAPHLTYDAGRLGFNRPPHFPPAAPARVIELPAPPDTPPRRRLPLLASLAPVLAAVLTFAIFRDVRYLAFMALAPLAAVWSWVDDRRSGRRDFAEASRRYRERVATTRDEAVRLRDEELSWRRATWPGPDELLAAARRTAPSLWRRRPGHDAFADVRVGTATLPARVSVRVPSHGGDDTLRSEAKALADELATLDEVPAVVPLARTGVLGVAGPRERVDAAARWLVGQLAAEHSPRDLVVTVLAAGHLAAWDWARWLPHVRALGAEGQAVAGDDASIGAAFTALRELVDARLAARDEVVGGRPPLPRVVAVVQPPLAASRAAVSELLGQAGEAGVSVVWLDEARAALPGECGAVLDLTGETATLTVASAERGPQTVAVRPEELDLDTARELALALAPLHDVTAAGSTTVPARVDLLDVLGLDRLDAAAVEARWASHPGGLRAAVGAGAGGAFSLDLEADPHALVGGTTGAGKSEFLQSLLLSWALTYPPDHATFVLVDYKGGAAFAQLSRLPHTVGFVTNLDGYLARRALVALEAELARRERIITREHGEPDLQSLRRRDPAAAPPSLVIVVDEFAVLAKQLGDFVDGLVDIAAKGRSLGVHLLLATQSPQGVISPKIADNASLRVAFRLNDAGQSRDLLGSADAATLPAGSPGRAWVRTGGGGRELVQTAWSGGPAPAAVQAPVQPEAHPLGRAVRRTTQHRPDAPSVRDAAVDAVAEAFLLSGRTPPERPWLPELPSHLRLDELPAGHTGAILAAAVGLVDRPAAQRQDPWVLDLERDGNVLVVGGPRSGRTTFLVTATLALARRLGPDALQVCALDLGRGELGVLAGLPHTLGVVDATDVELVYTLIETLDRRLERRRAGEESTSSRVLLLVDGYPGLRELLDDLDGAAFVDALTRVAVDGPGLGIHLVVTTDRRGALAPRLAGAFVGQLVLRLPDPADYAEAGQAQLARDAPDLPAGRAFTRAAEAVQLAALARRDETEADARRAAVDAVGSLWQAGRAPRLAAMPVDVARAALAPATAPDQPLGVASTGEVATVDLDRRPVMLVVGPDGSGRSTALASLVTGLLERRPDASAWLVAPRRSPLRDLGLWRPGPSETGDVLQAVLAEMAERAAAPAPGAPLVVVVDDADGLTDFTSPHAAALDLIVRQGRDAGVVLLAAVSSYRAVRASSGWLALARDARHGLLLAPTEESREVFQTRLPLRRTMRFPPGRGFLVQGGQVSLVQVAR